MKKLHRSPVTYQVRNCAEESLTTVLKKKIDSLRLGVRNNLAAFGTLLPVNIRSQLVRNYMEIGPESTNSVSHKKHISLIHYYPGLLEDLSDSGSELLWMRHSIRGFFRGRDLSPQKSTSTKSNTQKLWAWFCTYSLPSCGCLNLANISKLWW